MIRSEGGFVFLGTVSFHYSNFKNHRVGVSYSLKSAKFSLAVHMLVCLSITAVVVSSTLYSMGQSVAGLSFEDDADCGAEKG